MKKVALSLAGLLAAAAFAPEASALPVFARQTGMACNACHFQHFPILNGFGRAFKTSGYTLMGAQGKVEGDELSLPDRLNMAVLVTAGFEQVTGGTPSPKPVIGPGGVAIGTNGNHNQIHLPGNGGELSLFFGGKITDNAGFLSEIGLGPSLAGAPPGMTAAKLPMLYEIGGGTRAGLVFMTTDGQGPAHSFELLNTGASGVHIATPMRGNGAGGNDHFAAASAAQYLNTNTGAAGVSLVVANADMFFVNVGKYGINALANNVGGPTTDLVGSNYVRGAFIFDAGMNMAIGVEAISGHDALADTAKTNAQIVDFQAMGDVGAMPLLITASYGKAAKQTTPGQSNVYNPNAGIAPTAAQIAAGALVGVDRTALTVAASLGIAPHTTVKAALRLGKNGAPASVAATAANGGGTFGVGNTDNAVQFAATYGLAQNLELSLTYTRQSGDAWNTPSANNVAGLVAPAKIVGQNMTSLKLEALF